MSDNTSPDQTNEFESTGGWPSILASVSKGEELSGDQAQLAMSEILSGRSSESQVAGFLMALKTKGVSSSEVAGLARGMRAAATPLDLPDNAIDIVGTGGSPHRHKHALNVSTMSSFVAAAAGATVCKHGNVKASSTSGSFDFLAALGVNFEMTPDDLSRCVSEVGLGFAFAKSYHPAMRFAGPVRASLGVPTVFNILGPLAHPGRVNRQVVGTADEAGARQMAEVMVKLGTEKGWVVTGQGGLDEISTTGPSIIFDVEGGEIERREIDLRFLGITPPADMSAIAGGDADQNVAIFRSILDLSEKGSRRDIVALNAGAALVVAGLATGLARGLQAAEAAIDDGRAASKLEELVAFTNAL